MKIVGLTCKVCGKKRLKTVGKPLEYGNGWQQIYLAFCEGCGTHALFEQKRTITHRHLLESLMELNPEFQLVEGTRHQLQEVEQ